MSERRWPEAWDELKAGVGCPMCANRGLQDNGYGVRFLEGRHADAFLMRRGTVRGYAVAIWKHEHVAEPTQLAAERAGGFWLETLRAGAAIERHLGPLKMNYLTLGNSVPHLHTHIVPRYADDPAPGGPLPFDLLERDQQPEDRFHADLQALRAIVGRV